MLYEIVTWPEVQELIGLYGFSSHSYLINDERGINDFGSSAYFVESDWLKKLDSMTEEKYQYLNSLSIEDYEKSTTANEQLAFINYQIKNHPDDIVYCQGHNPD